MATETDRVELEEATGGTGPQSLHSAMLDAKQRHAVLAAIFSKKTTSNADFSVLSMANLSSFTLPTGTDPSSEKLAIADLRR
ncbi:hypothetical protein PF005_g14551 [Phytophthora fragariae]|uniref:Uncharacterized protein n=1 Tax=Phytophthora fragariae TaxID=53985 RepID=A0A6A3K6G3_9STRA|nr:hypothetical protein PF009_g15908 [Phytophthora fragariae]KAE9001942.1 hypothetical protein PF011_g13523 [Phytophthora fragariae]KAE9103617.1 hypothetical protein PF007_g14342 [Phytophthora fragariae]KAE9139421.1 hypothetical protein PF006_g13741 [Phytophthora fragariae]KAE9202462.1 hypothetical protein PF005_g14551 [Phytophthora fragariae]